MSNLSELIEHIIRLGVTAGDAVMLTCDVAWLADLECQPQDLLEILREILTPTGTLVTPNYADASWAVCGLTYQPNPVAEALIELPGSITNFHPTHPFVLSGRLATILAEDTEISSPFQQNSVTFRMLQLNAKQLMLGNILYQSPFVYLAEQISKVPYAENAATVPMKLQSGKVSRHVMTLPGCGTGFRVLEGEDILQRSDKFDIALASARGIFQAAREALVSSETALLCEEPDCAICAQSRAVIDATIAEKVDQQVTLLLEEEENIRAELERKLEGSVLFFETDHDSINNN